MSPANSDTFTSFFFFTNLNSLQTKTMLNKTGKTEHFCLIPDLRGSVFNLKTAEYMFLSRAYGTFSRIGHILGYKSNLSKFKKIEISSIFFISQYYKSRNQL